MDVGLIFLKSRSSQRIKQKNSPEDGPKINCDVSGGSWPMGGECRRAGSGRGCRPDVRRSGLFAGNQGICLCVIMSPKFGDNFHNCA